MWIAGICCGEADMIDTKNHDIAVHILGLMDTACEASLELLALYTGGELKSAQTLLIGLQNVVQAVASAQESLLPRLEHACTREMLENIEQTLKDIEDLHQKGRAERVAMKMEFQLFPFLRQLKESFYFWGMIYPDQKAMDRYYQEEFAAHYRNFYVSENDVPTFQLSVVVAAYNHLETTKRCISQLLKETDFKALDAELILIDHGSADGTLEYFENLGIGKVIHFKHNARMSVFTILSQLCQGKYFAFVSNDILVTRNWAQILLDCLSSDEKIIAAVPATPHIANLQMLHVPTDDPDQFIEWANTHNHSNPMLWDDRARLMPPLGMYRTAAVSQIGFADPYFYSMEFWDDDFSFRARRAGYRQVVCGDVACYHFGSVTGKEAQQKENTLEYGRELFKSKCGVDPWGNGFCYDYHMVQLVMKVIPAKGEISLLALDCGMGDTPMQIRNEICRRRQICQTYQLTSQEMHLPDLAPHSIQAFFCSSLEAGVRKNFDGGMFHCAVLGRDIGTYEDYQQLLEAVSKRLGFGGCFVFSCDNPFFVLNIHGMMQFNIPGQNGRMAFVAPESVGKEAEKYFSQVQPIAVEQVVDGLDQFAKTHWGDGELRATAVQRIKIKKYYFVCHK